MRPLIAGPKMRPVTRNDRSDSWAGAPAGTPREVLARLHAEIAGATGRLHQRYLERGIEMQASDSPQAFSAYIRSEADAFVAASLTQFSLTARLAFMVVGPMVDVKLVALQAGTFGRRFAARFAPLTFVVAVGAAVAVGAVLL